MTTLTLFGAEGKVGSGRVSLRSKAQTGNCSPQRCSLANWRSRDALMFKA